MDLKKDHRTSFSTRVRVYDTIIIIGNQLLVMYVQNQLPAMMDE